MKQFLVAVAILAGMGAAVHNADKADGSDKPVWMVTPCEYEDSSNCYWDAESAGDKRGHSFYSIRVGEKDCLAFWNSRYARHHNRCI